MIAINRRHAIAGSAGLAGLALFPGASRAAVQDAATMGAPIAPIGPDERARRLSRAKALMVANGIDAVLIEPGASLTYFTGVKWWRSERLTAAVLTREGDACIVTPFFEEPSIRESLGIPTDVRVWQEDESPIAVVAGFLRQRGLARGTIGIEETVRFFASDGLRQALPDAQMVSANPVVRGCRMIKSPAEIALMQRAADITVAAIKHAITKIEPDMTPDAIAGMIDAQTTALGGNPEFALVLLGEASAYPHGSGQPQRVRLREPILMDCGCSVEGYQSDISRTVVLGGATDEQRRVFLHMREGQQLAFDTAQIGVPAGAVDDAVRARYERWGYGPRYKLPGTSHRTGHGIGMDGHEPVNLVHGETTPLTAGMCFSSEPGIYLPGKFGIRIEDCFYLTESGPKWFSQPQRSIEYPAD